MTGLSGWPPRGETALSVIRPPSAVRLPTRDWIARSCCCNAPRSIGQDRLPPRDWMPHDALPITPHRTGRTTDHPAPHGRTADRPAACRDCRSPRATCRDDRSPHATCRDDRSPHAHRTADHPAPHGRAAGMPRTACLTADPAGSGGHAAVRARDRRAARAAVSGVRAAVRHATHRPSGRAAIWPGGPRDPRSDRMPCGTAKASSQADGRSGCHAAHDPAAARSPVGWPCGARRQPRPDPPTRPGNPTGNPTRQPGQATRASNPDQATPGSNPVRRTSRRSVRAIDEPTRSGGPVARRA
jgi:hypothetical protein